MQENMVINLVDSQSIEVYWQDEVVLDLDVELMYIKSGQDEIKHYVLNVSMPEIEAFTAKNMTSYALRAENAAKSAESSKTAAAVSEKNASTCSNSAQAGAVNAANSAATASKQATAAASSASAASASASKSAASANTASGKAAAAASSASSAATSASAASSSATDAAASAKSAAASAANIHDSNLLHKTGNEVKSGTLTAAQFMAISNAADSSLYQKHSGFTAGVKPSAAQMRSFRIMDSGNKILGDMRCQLGTDGTVHNMLLARNYKTDGTVVDAVVGSHVTVEGKAYTTVMTPIGVTASEAVNVAYADAKYAKLSATNVFTNSSSDCRALFKTTKYAVGNKPTENNFFGFSARDKNMEEYGTVYSAMLTTGFIKSALWVRGIKNVPHEISINVDSTDNVITACPAGENVNSIVTTLLKSDTACKLGNKFLVQFGQIDTSKGSAVVFDTPYKNTSYVVFAAATAGAADLNSPVDIVVNSKLKTTTGFSLVSSRVAFLDWVAVGYAA